MFATHSTHKLLAALSQTSYIHIRDGRERHRSGRFNESYMMHASTSPFYSDHRLERDLGGDDGRAERRALTHGGDRRGGRLPSDRGAASRSEFAEARRTGSSAPGTRTRSRDPKTGKRVAFEDAPEAAAQRPNPNCWVLHPGETWHGFDGLEDG